MSGRIGRRAAALMLTGALASAGLALTAGPAMALGPGRVCMFFAPSGAGNLGHTGWAFEEGKKDNWIYGATENPDGKDHNPSPSKAITGSWSRSGAWRSVLADFRASKDFHTSGYYQYYRCTNTRGSSVGAAMRRAEATQHAGYQLFTNNCLTKAVQIYKSYDSDGHITFLPDGQWATPSSYFWTTLSGGRYYSRFSWERAVHL